MLQVKTRPSGPFKIKSITAVTDAKCSPADSVCSINTDNGTGKPPC